MFELGINWEPNSTYHPENTMPTPYKPIGMDKAMIALFFGSMVISPARIPYREVRDLIPSLSVDTNFFYTGSSVIAVCRVFLQSSGRKEPIITWNAPQGWKTIEANGFLYGMKFYRIGCSHKIEMIENAFMMKQNRCVLCDYTAEWGTDG